MCGVGEKAISMREIDSSLYALEYIASTSHMKYGNLLLSQCKTSQKNVFSSGVL